jgi:hypothetical protein
MGAPVSSIDLTAWRAARPAARRVPALAACAAALVGIATAAASIALDQVFLLLIAAPTLGYGAWRLTRYAAAAHAVRGIRRDVRQYRFTPPQLARLVTRGETVTKQCRWLAIEDGGGVTLTTAPPAGPGPQLPLSVIANLGNSGSGM